ncbi:MAG: HAMP domain-containing sensor histidine kinase, partial [Clostridia bacterium]|nr:HAMP domain-containing sensor histidine kinase [Clostridia bacterium]
MIKRLKRKFIILATVSTFVLMAVLVGIMNIVNYSSVITETDMILNVLSQPNAPFGSQKEKPRRPPQDIIDFIPRGMSPEVPYESRYFTATVSINGVVEETDVSQIISVDREAADVYVQKAISSGHDRGFIEQFRYIKQTDDRMTRIMFLDCGRKLDSFRKFMLTSTTVGLLGCVVAFVVFVFSAGRIVRPIAESYEKQKRFITDAGHEIKTPLTIIGANLDLLESDFEDNESLSDIRTQTKRLSELTNDLVYLSKMEEEENEINKIEFPVSDIVAETAQQFHAIAQSKGKEYKIDIEPNLTMHGAPDAIRQLVSILLDNAMKYSPEKGTIELDMHAHKKMLSISV